MYYKSLGAKGIGEFTANLPVEDPLMQNAFYHAQKCDLPILFHIGWQGDDYGIVDGLGLYNIEATLQKFPKLRLIGHSHKWWSEISGEGKRRRSLLTEAAGLVHAANRTYRAAILPAYARKETLYLLLLAPELDGVGNREPLAATATPRDGTPAGGAGARDLVVADIEDRKSVV